uniref:Uncharacterized protein n=1 Tax=virus sp. ctv2g1 TaxID=2828000 RepID=A0A8S5TKD6_9VIRU|nr:MAG TPA: hypothetical protein [virus sp. ctv2g1]DAN78345.1 MAG TPA: hypothetical protein [Caudoviricetes sp.]
MELLRHFDLFICGFISFILINSHHKKKTRQPYCYRASLLMASTFMYHLLM